MIIDVFIALALALAAAGAPSAALERQDRQDTIYVLHGDPQALAAFHEAVGTGWTGGTVIDDDPSDGVLRYWAYSARTAAQSRALMMPAIFAGLRMDFEPYVEAAAFPAERRDLDRIAVACGLLKDPFFVTPKGSIERTLPADAGPAWKTCLDDGMRQHVPLPLTVQDSGGDQP